MIKRFNLAVLLAAGLALTAGCHRPPDKPSRFNNLMGESNAELKIRGGAFRVKLKDLKAGVGLKRNSVRRLYDDMEKKLKEVKAQWEDMWPPKGSETGEGFLDAYRKYLDDEEKILQIAEQITTIAEDNAEDNIRKDGEGHIIPNLDPVAQWARIEPLIEKMNSAETDAIKPVVEKQKEFIKEHNLNLVDPHQLKNEDVEN